MYIQYFICTVKHQHMVSNKKSLKIPKGGNHHPSCYSGYKRHVINGENSGLWLRQTEHIRGHLWHIYSLTFIMETYGVYGNVSSHIWKSERKNIRKVREDFFWQIIKKTNDKYRIITQCASETWILWLLLINDDI